MKYLNQIRTELPLNCLYNKVRVGCGGTTLAITNDKPYVIAVPYVSLVESKESQHNNLFGVKAGVSIKDIKEYIEETSVPKIITTYDGLRKVMEVIDPKDFYLLVDEYHVLFQQYSFRYDTIHYILENYNKFKAYTFMTATPVSPDEIHKLQLDELENIDYIEEIWSDDNELSVRVKAYQCKSPLAMVCELVKKHLTGSLEGNAYFFVNSLKFISQVFDCFDNLQKDARVIYSINNTKGYEFDRGSVSDDPKKINFLTSTTFEGCDIYDENGVTYIVSDSNKQHSLLDISTSVQQIVGRIRNSKYKGNIAHIYNYNRYSNLTPDEFAAKQEECMTLSVQISNEINTRLSEVTRKAIYTDAEEAPYVVKRGGVFFADNNLRKLDFYNYIVHSNYSCKTMIEDAYVRQNAVVESEKWFTTLKEVLDGVEMAKSTPKIRFVEAVKECREASLQGRMMELQTIRKYGVKFPLLSEAIEKLGYEQLATLQYVQSKIKDRLLQLDNHTSIRCKVIRKLAFLNGEWVSNVDAKRRLQKAYNALKINRTAKSTDLAQYYSLKRQMKTVNGKRVEGYSIAFPLFQENR